MNGSILVDKKIDSGMQGVDEGAHQEAGGEERERERRPCVSHTNLLQLLLLSLTTTATNYTNRFLLLPPFLNHREPKRSVQDPLHYLFINN